jgi:hypothetical protein
MAQGPSLIFDKSSLESLNLNEAVLMDNFYMSTITPLFFVECLADLEKTIRSKSTPEQLVGSLADRTPESQSYPNVHHTTILKAELSRQFDLGTVYGRVMLAGGAPVQLGDKKGFVFRQSPEAEALERWTKREFLEVERNIAKEWRRSLNRVDFDAMVQAVMGELGHWRTPKTLADAKQIADTVIDYMDPEWLFRFGLHLLGVPEVTDWVIEDWTNRRRPPLREHVPYFIFMLTINIFSASCCRRNCCGTSRQAITSIWPIFIIYRSAPCSHRKTTSMRRSCRFFWGRCKPSSTVSISRMI